MRFVEPPAFGTKANTAIKATLAAIGGDELLLRETDVPTASRLIGQACLAASGQQNPHLSQRRFAQAHAAMHTEQPGNFIDASRQRLAALTLEMLRHHNQPATAARLRSTFHAAIVDEIYRTTDRMARTRDFGHGGEYGALIGHIAELTPLGLLTRHPNPYRAALPALHHHDAYSDSSMNYDMLVVESVDATEPPTVAKAQVKARCLGFCGVDGAGTPNLLRSNYRGDITFVSAHCDLGVGGQTDLAAQQQTRQLLMQEASGRISVTGVQRLDDLTDQLLLNLTAPEPERVGALPLYDVAYAAL